MTTQALQSSEEWAIVNGVTTRGDSEGWTLVADAQASDLPTWADVVRTEPTKQKGPTNKMQPTQTAAEAPEGRVQESPKPTKSNSPELRAADHIIQRGIYSGPSLAIPISQQCCPANASAPPSHGTKPCELDVLPSWHYTSGLRGGGNVFNYVRDRIGKRRKDVADKNTGRVHSKNYRCRGQWADRKFGRQHGAKQDREIRREIRRIALHP